MSEVEAGREMDALIAEKIFGKPVECRLVGVGTSDDPMRLEPPDGVWRVRSERDDYWYRWSPDGAERVVNEFGVPHYSTNLLAAWEVVERLTQTTKQWFRYEQSSITYRAEFSVAGSGEKDGEWGASGDTAPLAICKAALATIEATL